MNALSERLLQVLMKNARASNTQLAKKLGVSEGTIRNQLKRLTKEGIITGFSADVSLRNQFMAIALLKTAAEEYTPKVVAKLNKIRGSWKVFEVSGQWDIVLLASLPSPEEYNEFIEKVRNTRGVESTQSLIVLRKS
ncbi:MAG: Lrp/AsnC family transcriptional regulator [Candidatus Diapherotrites archaeon]